MSKMCPLIIWLIVATTYVWEKKTGKDLTVRDNREKIAARMRVFGGLLAAMQEGEERVEVQVHYRLGWGSSWRACGRTRRTQRCKYRVVGSRGRS